MSVKQDELKGNLDIKKLPADLCYGLPTEFVKKLQDILEPNILVNPGNKFVVVGHATPAPEDKGKLWIRTSRSGIFQGYFFYQDSAWERIHNYRPDEVIWMYGDSRVIPEGFQLIDSSSNITSDIVDFIVKQYLKDQGASSPEVTVYNYFAVRYLG
jgi:hypothetical protein